MLTGRRAFQGDDVTDVITSVMRDTPDWQALPVGTPASIRSLLRRCLDKDARKRAPHMSIARLAIEDASSPAVDLAAAVAPPVPRSSWRLALITGVAAAAAASALTFTLTRNTPPPRANGFRYSIMGPARNINAPGIAVSRDGRYVAVAARDKSGNRQIWVRALDGPEEFAMLDGAMHGDFPFWSPDSREIAFFRNRRIMRIGVQGGAASEIANVEAAFANTTADGSMATWGANGIILFGRDNLYRVAATGGPIDLAVGGALQGQSIPGLVSWPQWLAGHAGVLYTRLNVGVRTDGALMYQPLPNGNATVVESRARAQVTRDGVLVARAVLSGAAEVRLHQFDPATGRLDQLGTVVVAAISSATLDFSASDTGVLVYQAGADGAPYQFEWVDAGGTPTGDSFDTIDSGPFNLSRDETQLAFMESSNLVVRDLSRGISTTLVQGRGVEPIFSPDGGRVAYSLVGNQRPSIVIQPSSGGAAKTLYESAISTLTEDWSSDGKYLAVSEGGRRGLILSVDEESIKVKQPPITYAEYPVGSALDEPRFSPDGHWLVYNAEPAGQPEVFLIPLPPTGEQWKVSLAGGSQGRWRRDGRALFYMAPNGDLMAVDVLRLTPGQRPTLGRPRVLFNTGLIPTPNIDQYAPNGDGTRFLLRRPRGSNDRSRLDVIVNWPALLNRPN